MPEGVRSKRYRLEPGIKLKLEKRYPADSSGLDGEEARPLDVSKKLNQKSW